MILKKEWLGLGLGFCMVCNVAAADSALIASTELQGKEGKIKAELWGERLAGGYNQNLSLLFKGEKDVLLAAYNPSIKGGYNCVLQPVVIKLPNTDVNKTKGEKAYKELVESTEAQTKSKAKADKETEKLGQQLLLSVGQGNWREPVDFRIIDVSNPQKVRELLEQEDNSGIVTRAWLEARVLRITLVDGKTYDIDIPEKIELPDLPGEGELEYDQINSITPRDIDNDGIDELIINQAVKAGDMTLADVGAVLKLVDVAKAEDGEKSALKKRLEELQKKQKEDEEADKQPEKAEKLEKKELTYSEKAKQAIKARTKVKKEAAKQAAKAEKENRKADNKAKTEPKNDQAKAEKLIAQEKGTTQDVDDKAKAEAAEKEISKDMPVNDKVADTGEAPEQKGKTAAAEAGEKTTEVEAAETKVAAQQQEKALEAEAVEKKEATEKSVSQKDQANSEQSKGEASNSSTEDKPKKIWISSNEWAANNFTVMTVANYDKKNNINHGVEFREAVILPRRMVVRRREATYPIAVCPNRPEIHKQYNESIGKENKKFLDMFFSGQADLAFYVRAANDRIFTLEYIYGLDKVRHHYLNLEPTTGKVMELKDILNVKDPDLLVFLNEQASRQEINLKELPTEWYVQSDRFYLQQEIDGVEYLSSYALEDLSEFILNEKFKKEKLTDQSNEEKKEEKESKIGENEKNEQK